MQFAVTDDPWERGTDLTASNSSHLSISSSNNLKTEVFYRPAAMDTWIATVQFQKMVTSCLKIASFVVVRSFPPLSPPSQICFWLVIMYPAPQSIFKGKRLFYPENTLRLCSYFTLKTFFFFNFSTFPSNSMSCLAGVSVQVWVLAFTPWSSVLGTEKELAKQLCCWDGELGP